jgi:hypothetical protein
MTLLTDVKVHINNLFLPPDRTWWYYAASFLMKDAEEKVDAAFEEFKNGGERKMPLPTLAQCLALRYVQPSSAVPPLITGALCAMGRGDLLYVVDGYPVGAAKPDGAAKETPVGDAKETPARNPALEEG